MDVEENAKRHGKALLLEGQWGKREAEVLGGRKSTGGNGMTEDKITNRALGLPNGSVRAILAIGFVGSFCWMQIQQMAVSDIMISLTSMAVGFYFGQKLKSPSS